MAKTDIIQNMIAELGQSQDDRFAAELTPHFFDVDERSPLDMAAFAEAYAEFVTHYSKDLATQTTFQPFFGAAEARAEMAFAQKDGKTPPHFALFLSFLELREQNRALLNRLTERHYDFQTQRVLHFSPRASEPDRAHLVVEMKKGAARTSILPTHQFSAGKDSSGVVQVYSPARETVVGTASVAELRSIYINNEKRGAVHSAPYANSADGLGEELPEDAAYFSPFGHSALPLAEVGFALASPVLKMAEGTRKVTISLWATDAPQSGPSEGVFEALVTGEKGWLGPFTVRLSRVGSRLDATFEVPETEGAIVEYSSSVHGGTFVATAPIVEMILIQGKSSGYADWKDALLEKVKIAVEVQGIKTLDLESDYGKLDPKKAFYPFGLEGTKNTRFMIACSEALGKSLEKLDVHLSWQSLPSSFSTLYANYEVGTVSSQDFTVNAVFEDADASPHSSTGIALFPTSGSSSTLSLLDAKKPKAPKPKRDPSRGMVERARRGSGMEKERAASVRESLVTPTRKDLSVASSSAAREGAITLTLTRGFMFDVYRLKTAENMREQAEQTAKNAIKYATMPTPKDEALLNAVPLITLSAPYAPKVEAISVDYAAATSTLSVSSATETSFANPDLQFFHIDAFGVRREHAYLRNQLSFLKEKTVPLLPSHTEAGELLIGLSDLSPGDSVSLLFRVVAASASPDIEWPTMNWSVLSNNAWRPLTGSEVALDTTSVLRSSGLYVLAIPNDATTVSTILPTGRIWLKLGVSGSASGVSKLWGVHANGVEVVFQSGSDTGGHAPPLVSGTIAKLLSAVEGVKKISQPDATFGGRAEEEPVALRARAAERIRHRNRCITPWDYERMVLEAFPGLHRVKCIPHATKEGSFLAPGHVLVIVVPDLRNAPSTRLLEPRADVDTLASVEAFLKERVGGQVQVAAKNPEYQKIRVDFGVKFRGADFNSQRDALQKELIELLSPWAYDSTRSVAFGGRVYRSAILDFVEERSYVDYVTDFAMRSYTTSPDSALDRSEAIAERPDAVLVSSSEHGIVEAR